MTQFLLIEAVMPPSLSGMTWKRLLEAPYLVKAARANFPDIHSVWVGRSQDGEISVLIDDAADAMGRNQPYEDTVLAAVLTKITEHAESLALFWATYPDTLPVADTVEELHRIVETDLRESPGGEIYVRWRRSDSLEL